MRRHHDDDDQVNPVDQVNPFPPRRIPFVRSSLFNYDTFAASEASGLRCLDESKTVQSQADEADINTIVRNFGITNTLPQVLRLPSYGDFEGVSDFHEAQNLISEAKSAFYELPAALREEFGHDPGALIDWAETATPEQLLEKGIERITLGSSNPPQSSPKPEPEPPKSEGGNPEPA